MASTSPAEIGTQGTIGSLVSKEIEYFRCHETGRHKTSHQQKKLVKDMESSSMSSANKKKKKKKQQLSVAGSRGFMPSICSAVEISNGNATGYINLRTDGNKFSQD